MTSSVVLEMKMPSRTWFKDVTMSMSGKILITSANRTTVARDMLITSSDMLTMPGDMLILSANIL
jgi:hypothetical protein